MASRAFVVPIACFIFFLGVIVMLSFTDTPTATNLTDAQMAQIRGAQNCAGCQTTTDATTCKQTDEKCKACATSLSKDALEPPIWTNCATSFKKYGQVSRQVCVPNPPMNNKFCDPGTITCY